MKKAIEIWNQNTGINLCTLNDLREMNCIRRKRILSGEGLAKIAQKEITVHTTDKTKHQKCCHYTSFQLRQMNADKAIAIYNHDGSQKAKITYEKATTTQTSQGNRYRNCKAATNAS